MRGDMCAFGMWQKDHAGQSLVVKPTGLMTNAGEIASELNRTCTGGHRHIPLVGGRAHRAEVYPGELCFKIVQGLIT